ncbi:MAG: type I DNA topoisomerase, partial [Gemmataceae bacterium]|nr:type I DNA topoisomerase [Gemmataceae bacterium]
PPADGLAPVGKRSPGSTSASATSKRSTGSTSASATSKRSTGEYDLVIVESPAKAKTINKYLGRDFRVIASYGHVRDLPRRKRKGEEIAGVKIAEGWVPQYVVEDPEEEEGKTAGRRKTPRQILEEINEQAKKARRILLATDPDREGEAIAWHIKDALNLDDDRTFRIRFNEITKSAVQQALANVDHINMDLVRAQEARRVLDRVVGYPLSNLLGKKVTRGLSAGRVQSVAVRLIVEREREIEAFRSEEYWKLTALLTPRELAGQVNYTPHPSGTKIYSTKKRADDDPEEEAREERAEIESEKAAEEGSSPAEMDQAPDLTGVPKPPPGAFDAVLWRWEGAEPRIANEQQVDEYAARLKDAAWVVTKLERKQRLDRPSPPYTTSTLQMDANRRLRFSADRTMKTAQRLYEGVDIGSEGSVGLITYMRTDSTRVSDDALRSVRGYIEDQFGRSYLPDSPNVYRSGKSAQGAHEAIRPTDLANTPERVRPYLKPDEYRLYELIFNRFVASQMAPAIDDVTNVEVTAGPGIFKAQGRIQRFDGYRRVFPTSRPDETELPPLREQQDLVLLDLFESQHFTQPPPRFNEASLVKALEKEGIGRPSTYASIIETIQKRGYVQQKNRRFYATEIGKLVTDLLVKHFQEVMDLKFTSHIEEDLDKIESRETEYEAVLNEFWGPFSKALATAEEAMPKVKGQQTGETCPKCGAPLVKFYTKRRGGEFVSCSAWKKDGSGCDYVKPVDGQPELPPLKEEVACPTCGKPMLVKRGPRGPFLGCSGYPECKTTMRITAEGKAELTAAPTEHKCDKCGAPMVIRRGRRGPFLACSAYPKCRNAQDVDAEGNPVRPVETGVTCDKCQSPMIVRRGPRGPFLACSAYPKCRSSKPIPEELKEKLSQLLPAPKPKVEVPPIEVTEVCPQCGSGMKLRPGRNGYFLGCSKYPKCRGTMPAPPELLERLATAQAKSATASPPTN